MVVSYAASKRVSTATDFWAAGRSLSGPQNGFAIAGDYMSAASFLGIAGLIFLFGFDGFLYSVGFLVAFLTVLFLLAERMRNAGKFTIADVLSFRLKERPARVAAALGTLAVVGFYLIAQMVGAGVIIQALVGIDFSIAVILTGAFMVSYIILGGMLATSWVQIIKAFLLMTAAVVMTIAPVISRPALMICTQVVASMPPNTTYISITAPVTITATEKSTPTSAWMITPAPTICAIR
jgi:cation/acetate symporter